MDRDKAREILVSGGMLHTGAWIFTEQYMNCGDESGCCYDTFDNVEVALDSVEDYSGNNWNEVREL